MRACAQTSILKSVVDVGDRGRSQELQIMLHLRQREGDMEVDLKMCLSIARPSHW